MQFYSTNNHSVRVSLKEAVLEGLAPDNGLYMPVTIPKLPETFFKELKGKSFQQIGIEVTKNIIGDDLTDAELEKIVSHTIQFDAPLVKLEENIFALELFHGPTLAFKDFGARFLSGMLSHYAKQQEKEITILVATSGDTGSAVANGFYNVPGTRVVVLYPSGKVSDIQEKQFTTLGGNITALEIDGTFDDCQRLVKEAFLNKELKEKLFLTSANSINIARLIPQSFYYFYAYSRLSNNDNVVFSVPSGNFGNLTAGLLAQRMGLPIRKFIASTNVNDIVPEYLKTSVFSPRPSTQTISNAMDVGNPSNFARMLDLYQHDVEKLRSEIVGYSFTDKETEEVMLSVFNSKKYTLDPHGAIGYMGLKKYMANKTSNEVGVFLETAHPAKFTEVVEHALKQKIELPEKLQHFMSKQKKSIAMKADFNAFKNFLLS